jgi:hypothetical protein
MGDPIRVFMFRIGALVVTYSPPIWFSWSWESIKTYREYLAEEELWGS